MSEITGRCLCGRVTWAASGKTTRNLVCHCADCQRATSSPFTAFLGFPSEAVCWTGDAIDFESSPGTFRGFCPNCGTRLYFRSSKWPDEIHVHAATLSEPQTYNPTAQVVLRSRAAWLGRLAGLPAHEGFEANPEERAER